MISVHPNRRDLGLGLAYSKGWTVWPTNDVRLIATALLRNATSPIVFNDGRRRRSEFAGADWIALDFDFGVSLAEITDTFCDHIHIIGTTKSHQIEKNGTPACDRFRLWLRVLQTITSAEVYESTVRYYCRKYEADPQAVDAARLFWPCREITSFADQGFYAEVHKPEPRRETTVCRPAAGGYYRQIPSWVNSWLANGVDVGQRNITSNKCGYWLGRNGYSEDEITAMVLDSNVWQGEEKNRQLLKEVRDAVRSGMEYANKER